MKRTATILALAAIGTAASQAQFYSFHVGTDGVGFDISNILPVMVAPPPPRVVHVPFVPGYVPPPPHRAAKKAAKEYRKAAKHYRKAVEAWTGIFAAPAYYYDYDDDDYEDYREDYYKHMRKHYKHHYKKHHKHHGHHRHHHHDDDDDD